MAGVTNKGKFAIMNGYFRAQNVPTTFYVALVTSATAPTADINTKSELTELTQQYGYTTGGIAIARDTTDFDTLTEDDGNDKAILQIKDIVWTASGGSIGAARYAVLTDDNVTQGSRIIIAWWDLGSDRTVSDTQTLTLQNCEIDLTE